jgi:uncharacterized protein (DUF1697 family)
MTSTCVALLRAVNVAGHGAVSMSDLRRFATDLGFADVRTVVQSGNLVFGTDRSVDAELERLLESEAAERLNLRTDFLVRSADDWAAIVEHNPFMDEAEDDPGRLVVMVLREAPNKAAVEALQAAVAGPEQVRATGRELYVTYPDGIGRSKLTGSLIETRLGTRGTARNWNTVLKLAELVCT